MLKLGDKNIKKLYQGNKLITKACLGDKLVYHKEPTFLEYIEFDGQSYIDTGIIPTNNTGAYCKLISSAKDQTFLGSRNDLGNTRLGLICTNNAYIGLGRAEYLYLNLDGSIAYKEVSARVLIQMNNPLELWSNFNNDKKLRVKQGQIDVTGQPIKDVSFTPQFPMFLGGMNITGEHKSACTGKVLQCQITEGNTLLLDLRPCINPNGIVCFYDTVTKKYFYNQGTGQFKAGGKFVESILFDGASYIDTGVVADFNTEVETMFMATKGNTGVYGNYPTFTGFVPTVSGTTARFRFSDTSAIANVPHNTILNIKHNSSGVDLNNIHYDYEVTPSNFSDITTMLLGCLSNQPNGGNFVGKLHIFKINKNGELIQDLRPFVDENEVACFYDMVTGTKFYNRGTGTLGYTEE